jgi:hypothetical protein
VNLRLNQEVGMFLRLFLGRRTDGLGLLIACVVGLLFTAAAAADALQPVNIGPVTVGDGAASGAAGSGGSAPTGVTVSVNGQPATVDANGNVSASVDLTGQSTVTLSLTDTTTGQATTITIPVDLLAPGGVIPASVLDMLRQAGVTVDVPAGGFTSVRGEPLRVSGAVADQGTLASLTVDGLDVLSLVQPDTTFTVPVPGTDKTVVVTATDKQGVTESAAYQITPAPSPSGSRAQSSATTVAAASANGVVIAAVRYVTKGVRAQKRISVILTIKDKRGLLIHGAKVRIRPAFWQNSLVVGTPAAKLTDTSGRVTFTLKLRAAKFNQRRRLFTVATALTSSAHVARTTSVRLPRLTRLHTA